MAKRKKKISKINKNDLTESTLYRAIMKRKYQQSSQVGAGKYPLSYTSPAATAGAQNIANAAEGITGTEVSDGNVNPASAIGSGVELAGNAVQQIAPEGKYGKTSGGDIVGKTVSGIGKGIATGAAIGSLLGPAGTFGGAAIGGFISGVSSLLGAKNESKEGAGAWAQSNIQGGQNFLAQQENQFTQEQRQNQQTRDANSNQGDVLAYNSFSENPFPGQTPEEQYAAGGRIGSLIRHQEAQNRSEMNLREKLNELRRNITTSGGMGMDVRRGTTGSPYNAGLGGETNINTGSFGARISGGVSPQYGPEGFAGLGYGGGANVTYNPKSNIQLRAGIGGGGIINREGASTPQLNPNIGLKVNFNQGGNVRKYQQSAPIDPPIVTAEERAAERSRQHNLNLSQNSEYGRINPNDPNIYGPDEFAPSLSAPGVPTNILFDKNKINSGFSPSYDGKAFEVIGKKQPYINTSDQYMFTDDDEELIRNPNYTDYRRGPQIMGHGGMVNKRHYEAGGSVEDEYTDALNNIAQGYTPLSARQNKNQFAQQIGPNREITEPGVYQVNGPSHEEQNSEGGTGTYETVQTLNGPEKAEFDDEEILETTVAAGGMETFAFNNHEGDKDGDEFASIQTELDTTQKELELIAEMNPEYTEEIKKALS
jgi:hypothetical protein